MNLKKTITPGTVGNNFTKYLKESEDIKSVNKILPFMNKALLGIDQHGYISIDQYIHFYNIIPKKLWSEKPIFYYRKSKYDALGFLLESPHKFTMQSKTLSLYFQEILNITITSVWDDPSIKEKRSYFLSCLKKIKETSKGSKLIRVYNKAKEIYNDRYY